MANDLTMHVISERLGIPPDSDAKVIIEAIASLRAQVAELQENLEYFTNSGRTIECPECGATDQSLSQRGCTVCGAWFTLETFLSYATAAEAIRARGNDNER